MHPFKKTTAEAQRAQSKFSGFGVLSKTMCNPEALSAKAQMHGFKFPDASDAGRCYNSRRA